jgi:hypothetical protein
MRKIITLALCLNALPVLAAPQFYSGLMLGYGSTNWNKLQTSLNPNNGLDFSLPTSTEDSGLVSGVFLGMDLNKYYGAEIRYQHFKDSTIKFEAPNAYHDDLLPFSMVSKTQSVSFVGKLRIPATAKITLYSLLGGAFTMRQDELGNVSGFGGVFGFGTQYNLNAHWKSSLEFDFVTGNAKISEYPAKDYLPFLTSFNYKLSYYF